MTTKISTFQCINESFSAVENPNINIIEEQFDLKIKLLQDELQRLEKVNNSPVNSTLTNQFSD